MMITSSSKKSANIKIELLTHCSITTILPSTICQHFLSTHSPSTSVDIFWNDFMSICNTCMALVPTKLSSTKHHQPWINSCIKRLTRKKQRAYNHARATNTEYDWAKYKDIKRQCQYECRKSFNQYISNLINPNSNAVPKCCSHILKVKKLITHELVC